MEEDEDEPGVEPRDDAAVPDAAVNPALALWLLGDQGDDRLTADRSSDD